MLSFNTSARKRWMTWVTLGGGLLLLAAPLALDPRVAWVCLLVGGLFSVGALIRLVANPTWGTEVKNDTVTIWHEPKRLRRSVSVTELKAIHVVSSVAHLELQSKSLAVPPECVNDDAVAWAQSLHARYPHVELRVE